MASFSSGLNAGSNLALKWERLQEMQDERALREGAKRDAKELLGEDVGTPERTFLDRIGDGIMSFFRGSPATEPTKSQGPTSALGTTADLTPSAPSPDQQLPAPTGALPSTPGAIQETALPAARPRYNGPVRDQYGDPGPAPLDETTGSASAALPPRRKSALGRDDETMRSASVDVPNYADPTIDARYPYRDQYNDNRLKDYLGRDIDVRGRTDYSQQARGGEGDDAITGQGPAPAAPTPTPNLSRIPNPEMRDYVAEAARKRGIPVDVLAAIPSVETGGKWNPDARNPADQFDAQGRRTVDSVGLGQFPAGHPGADPNNWKAQIDHTADRLAANYKRFGDWDKATLAHNRGEAGVERVADVAKDPYMQKIREHRKLYGGEGGDAVAGDPAAMKEKFTQLTRVPQDQAQATDQVAFNPNTGKQATKADWETYYKRIVARSVATGNPALISAAEQAVGRAMAGGILRNGAYLMQALESGDAQAVKLYGERLYGYIPDGRQMQVELGPNKTLKVTQFDEKTGKKIGEQTIGKDQLEKMYIGAHNPEMLARIISGRENTELRREENKQRALDRQASREDRNFQAEENRALRRETDEANRQARKDIAEANQALAKERQDDAERQRRQVQTKDATEQLDNMQYAGDANAQAGAKKLARSVVGDFTHQYGMGAAQAAEIAHDIAHGKYHAKMHKGEDGKERLYWFRRNRDDKGNYTLDDTPSYVVGPAGVEAIRAAAAKKRGEETAKSANDAAAADLARRKAELDEERRRRSGNSVEDRRRRATEPQLPNPVGP